MLLHLPDGHGAEQVRDAMIETIATLPAHLWRSLTWDRGTEMVKHREITVATGLPIYFCDPRSPWQRGSNENTVSVRSGPVGVLRQAGVGNEGVTPENTGRRFARALRWTRPLELPAPT